MTNQTRFQAYNGTICRAQLQQGLGYSFTFGTSDPTTFGFVASVKQLNDGVHYDLARLRTIPPVGLESAELQILRDLSAIRDKVLIQLDHGTNELIGSIVD
jgi:hypothetical protein